MTSQTEMILKKHDHKSFWPPIVTMAAAVSTRTKSLSDPVDAIMESSSTSLLDVAFVYDKDSNSCDHKVSLSSLVGNRNRQSTQHGPATCPVCKLPIALVRDQAALDPASQTVSFKYGKLTYELSLPDEASESNHKSSSTLWLLPFASTKKTPNTVQARIAHALGLNMSDMKVRACHWELFEYPACRLQVTSAL